MVVLAVEQWDGKGICSQNVGQHYNTVDQQMVEEDEIQIKWHGRCVGWDSGRHKKDLIWNKEQEECKRSTGSSGRTLLSKTTLMTIIERQGKGDGNGTKGHLCSKDKKHKRGACCISKSRYYIWDLGGCC